MRNWRSKERRFVAHPGALLSPDHYAMEMVEGRKTRNDVRRESFAYLYSGGLQKFTRYGFKAIIGNAQKDAAK